MSARSRILTVLALLPVLLFAAPDALAVFHLWQVSEVYTDAAGNVQYIEFSTTFDFQEQLAGHTFRTNSDGQIRTFIIPSDLNSSSTGNKTFILATPAFEDAAAMTPDYELPCGPFFDPEATSITVELVGADSVTFSSSQLPASSASALHFTAGGTGSTGTATPKNFAGTTKSMSASCLAAGNCPSSCDGTPPQISAGQQATVCRNGSATVTIANVSDSEDSAGSLVVNASSEISGVTVTNIVNNNGTVTATLTANGTATLGIGTISMLVTDTDAMTDTADLSVNVINNAAPVLGDYPDTTVVAGNSTTVTPSAPPSDDGSIVSVEADITANFAGDVTVNPTTGVVSITNAGGGSSPYTVTVTATDNCGSQTVETFQLTVNSLSSPTNLVATLTQPGTASLTWTAAPGAMSYRIFRRSAGSDWTLLSSTATTNYPDSAISADKAYLYRVQSIAGGASSAFSLPDYITTFGYADALVAGVTKVHAQHLLELREAVDALHAAAGMTLPTWTPAALADATIEAAHVNAVRSNLNAFRTSLFLATQAFTDTLTAGSTKIRKLHLTELRAAAKGYCATPGCS